jgi:hypothetical protein
VATIKTQLVDGQRRIITKLVEGQRRVSCSCCEVECCPYPAQGLIDGLYAAEDLPDELKAVINFDGDLGVISKDSNVYRYTFTGEDGPIAAIIRVNPDIIFDLGAGWENVSEATGLTIGLPCACLFGVCSDFGVEDNFADTYTVERRTETLTGPPDATFTITRESLCRWCGFDPLLESTICLEYSPPTFAGQGHWDIGGFGEATPRNNSSPVGNYNDGGSIWMVLEP